MIKRRTIASVMGSARETCRIAKGRDDMPEACFSALSCLAGSLFVRAGHFSAGFGARL
jgi:hypothetical protein